MIKPIGLLLAALLAPPALAQSLSIEPDRDATLIESADGALANGSGPALFVGRTNQGTGSVRRALLHFALPAIPSAGQGVGVVDRVALVVHVVPGNPGPREVRLYAMLGEWSEGPSVSGGGIGAPALPGDVTWLHASYGEVFWPTNGGQFDGFPMASTVVDEEGTYRFESAELTRLVAAWASSPGQNFGILLAGDETVRQTSKALASREDPDPALRPALEITLRPHTAEVFPRPRATALGRR